MKFRLVLSPQAERDLGKAERSIFVKIDRALLLLSKSPYPIGARPLKDKRLAQFRIRIGDYRVLYDVYFKDKVIYILRIGHRKDIYK